ncbi:MAG: ferredoxin [Bacteroidetes bacterium]|nr:ferredoxin [Bacteroidota bacterium]
MSSYKVEFDENTCTGTLNCVAVAGDHFKEDEQKNEVTGKMELIIGDDHYETFTAAMLGCPSSSIKVTPLDD